jgi:SOS response associated peptidase (SRAP)
MGLGALLGEGSAAEGLDDQRADRDRADGRQLPGTVETRATVSAARQRILRVARRPGGTEAPYYITAVDQPVFAFAGLWDRSIKPDGAAIESVVHVTVPANDLMRRIHNAGNNPHRMPAILDRSHTEALLTGSNDEAFACLKPYPAGMMAAWEVNRAVNSPKNNDAALIEPMTQLTAHQPSVRTDDGQPSMDLPLLDPDEPIDES